ncbi:PilW family protein [Marisediminicola sp. LYQ85]|uniref:PilW family protein n=1 Tax=Marisediminicola sp. LYQ85 TaxID=3391062 RepID=UPI003983247B
MNVTLEDGRDRGRDAMGDERGFTLIELLVYSLLLSIVVTIVVSIYLSSNRVEQEVRHSTTSTTELQVAVSSLDSGVRNASAFELTTSGANELLRARTAGGEEVLDWRCTAWYYAPAGGGKLWQRSSAAAISDPSATGTTDGWTLLLSGVTPKVVGGRIFAASNRTVVIDMGITSEDAPKSFIRSEVSQRTPGQDGGACF